MPKDKKIRVSIYVPEEIHNFVSDSCERVINVKGKSVKFTKSINEAYIEFIKKGIQSCEDDEQEE